MIEEKIYFVIGLSPYEEGGLVCLFSSAKDASQFKKSDPKRLGSITHIKKKDIIELLGREEYVLLDPNPDRPQDWKYFVVRTTNLDG